MEKSYNKLIVWKKAMDLVSLIYEFTKDFPNSEIYGLTSQMRRAAVSIPSNIAEGSRRRGKDLRQFFIASFGSGAELETQLEISQRLSYGDTEKRARAEEVLEEIMKMLNKMVNS